MTHKKRKTGNVRIERITHPELVDGDLAERAQIRSNNDRKAAFSNYVGLYRVKFPFDSGLNGLKINNYDLQAWYDKNPGHPVYV